MTPNTTYLTFGEQQGQVYQTFIIMAKLSYIHDFCSLVNYYFVRFRKRYISDCMYVKLCHMLLFEVK